MNVKKLTGWLVRHRILVIIVCLALLVPSVLGMAATKTKYDLLYYLPDELETVQGQNILLEDFGKGAFSLLFLRRSLSRFRCTVCELLLPRSNHRSWLRDRILRPRIRA